MNDRILIIDNDAQARHKVHAALEGQGYELDEAGDRSAALSRLQGFCPRVVIADIELPGLEGVRLIEAVRRCANPPLLIFIAPETSRRSAIQALSAGAHDYLTEPFESDELRERARLAIERQKLLEEVAGKHQACEVANDQLRASQAKIKEYAQQLEKNLVELRHSQLQLIQAEKMAALGRLVAGVAHEINTPVGSLASNNDLLARALPQLKGYLACVPECPEKPRIMEVLDVVSKIGEVDRIACKRITEIVGNLKNFARLDQAERMLANIHEGLDSTLRLLQWELKNRIRVEKDYGELPQIECHPNQLNQVFMNLLMNAAQAIQGEGMIRITTRHADDKVIVQIADTGKGISPEHLNKIFDPGFTTKGVGVGTGLGLSITYKIVQNHGGSIQVESKVGQGTVFTVTLPVH